MHSADPGAANLCLCSTHLQLVNVVEYIADAGLGDDHLVVLESPSSDREITAFAREHYADYFASKQLHLIYGTEDPFITEERLRDHRQLIEEQRLDFEVNTFEGKHVVDRAALRALDERIRLS